MLQEVWRKIQISFYDDGEILKKFSKSILNTTSLSLSSNTASRRLHAQL